MPKTKRARRPIRNRQRVTTPLRMQTHVTECAAACLGSVLAYFGRWVSLSELRERCEVSRDGSSAAGVLRAARHYGLECKGWHGGVRQLKKLELPLILFWEFRHFLILEGFDKRRFFLNDPAVGRRTVSAEEFAKGFTGVALRFQRGPKFERGGVRPSLLQHLPQWLHGAWGTLAYAAACGLLLAALALVTPAALALFVDQVLGEGEPWGAMLATAMAGGAALSYLLGWMKQRWLRRLSIGMAVLAGNHFMTRLLRLPISYFDHRLVGDLTTRIVSVDRIARGLAEHFSGVLIEMAMSAIFLAVILAYSPYLGLFVLALAVVNGVLVRVIARLRTDRNYVLTTEQGAFIGVGMAMLHQGDNLRMTVADDGFFDRWSGHQARELVARHRFLEAGHIITALPQLFLALGNAAVLLFGAAQVMSGQLTLGALAGLYLVAGMFLGPIGRFVELADERQALEADLMRLEDITSTAQDPVAADRQDVAGRIATIDNRLRLVGRLELRGVTFGYNRNRPPLLDNFSLIIEPGQRIAVVGPSGSGKSTLAKLVAGIHQPWSGEILLDGHPRDKIPEEVLARSVSMVDQRIILFSSTVRDNITLWNPAVPEHDLVAAARDACIHKEILARPLGYKTPVSEGGVNFSGGQRQRLEIARALVSNPTLLVLDEATSALDASTEADVEDALRRRGASCLIVAHRLSTIRDCDEIIFLAEGKTVQRGGHEELMADSEGPYYQLVRSG